MQIKRAQFQCENEGNVILPKSSKADERRQKVYAWIYLNGTCLAGRANGPFVDGGCVTSHSNYGSHHLSATVPSMTPCCVLGIAFLDWPQVQGSELTCVFESWGGITSASVHVGTLPPCF